MGDPKKKHKRYTTPKRPYDFANLEAELKLVGAYSLRNKRELWSHRTKLSTLRRRARKLLSMDPVARAGGVGRGSCCPWTPSPGRTLRRR
jgi:ribosomal protein S4